METPSNASFQSVGLKGVTTFWPQPHKQRWLAVAYIMEI
jgi:hypothetical protein